MLFIFDFIIVNNKIFTLIYFTTLHVTLIYHCKEVLKKMIKIFLHLITKRSINTIFPLSFSPTGIRARHVAWRWEMVGSVNQGWALRMTSNTHQTNKDWWPFRSIEMNTDWNMHALLTSLWIVPLTQAGHGRRRGGGSGKLSVWNLTENVEVGRTVSTYLDVSRRGKDRRKGRGEYREGCMRDEWKDGKQ